MSTAKTKVNSRRPRSPLDRERYTAELSTTQLVIGVCILLMFGLGCFLLGVLIGKFDPSLRDQMAEVLPGQQEPAPDPIDDPGAAPRTTRAVLDGSVNLEDRPPHNLVNQPPAQSEPAPSTATAQPPAAQPSADTASTPAAATQSPAQASQVSVEPPPAEPPRQEPVVTAPPLQPSVVAPPPAQAQAPAPATAAQGIYGVQIIAASRPRADAVKRDIESRSPYKAEVIAIDGDRLCKVVVGRFQDERSALAARNDLRTKYPFKDAFVISLK